MQAQSRPYPAWGQPLIGSAEYTIDDVQRIPDDGFRYELYRGVLIRMPGTGGLHGLICQFIGRIMEEYWRGRGERFRVLQNVGFDFTFAEDPSHSTMLVPDIAIQAQNALPDAGIMTIPPLIAIEVVSPGDRRKEVVAKTAFYLGGGVAEVWNVWPKTRSVDVWTAPTAPVTFTEAQTLTSAQLPGWGCLVSRCFDGD